MAKEKKTKEKATPKDKKPKKEKSSSGGGMQQMFMDHGEKIGLGIAGLIFLVCVAFGFINKTKLDDGKSVESLGTAIDGVNSKMADIKYTPEKDPAWVELAKSEAKIPPAPLALKPWVYPLFQLQGVRTEPNYFPAEQLRVIAGRAPFNVGAAAADASGQPAVGGASSDADPPDGSSSKGEFYVVGTFLIPVGAQRAEFDLKFNDTLKMPGDERLAQDKPEYFRYVLERAQVTPGTPDDQLQWVALNEADNAGVTEDNRFPGLEAKKAEWAEMRQDLIPAPFTEPTLTYGSIPKMDEFVPWLPPRLPKPSTQWTWSEVGHGVIADMVSKFAQQSAAADAATKPADATTADPEDAIKKFAAAQPYKMGRFWDFAVEPGAQYRYRVTLVLRNPNRGYTKQYLKEEKLAAGDFRPVAPLDAADAARPVSEPSYVVQIPGRSEIVVAGIVPEGEAGNRTGEDAATVAATVWENTAEAIADYEKEVNLIRVPRLKEPALQALNTLKEVWAKVDYVEAAMEFRVFRGQFLSMKSPTQINHPLVNKVETLRNVRFDTGFTLVDIRGGKAPAKSAAAMVPPAEYLLLDPAGNLVIRSEIGDRATYKRKLAAVKQAEAEDAAPARTRSINSSSRSAIRANSADRVLRAPDGLAKGRSSQKQPKNSQLPSASPNLRSWRALRGVDPPADLLVEKSELISKGGFVVAESGLPRIVEIERDLESLCWPDPPATHS